MKKIKYWFRSLKYLKSVKDAQELNLEFLFNVYGDTIITWNCRSVWSDEFGFLYRCQEILDDETKENLKLIKLRKNKIKQLKKL